MRAFPQDNELRNGRGEEVLGKPFLYPSAILRTTVKVKVINFVDIP
jgi:hypothetical protein